MSNNNPYMPANEARRCEHSRSTWNWLRLPISICLRASMAYMIILVSLVEITSIKHFLLPRSCWFLGVAIILTYTIPTPQKHEPFRSSKWQLGAAVLSGLFFSFCVCVVLNFSPILSAVRGACLSVALSLWVMSVEIILSYLQIGRSSLKNEITEPSTGEARK